MKHHISVTVRVDGGIEHIFDQVLEGRKKTFHLVCEAAQAMNYINQESEWRYDRGPEYRPIAKRQWPGASRSILRWWDSRIKAAASTSSSDSK